MKLVHTVLGAAVAAASPLAGAATFTVSSLADSGAGSLRDAIAQANTAPGADTVQFEPGLTGTIALAGEIRISDTLSLGGPDASRIAIDGGGTTRLFKIQRASGEPITATIAGVTLKNGHADEGGAIFSNDDNLVVSGVALTQNSATIRGGALWVASADLTVNGSQIVGNAAPTGGGILFSAGMLRVDRSLVADNTADFGAGANILSPAANAVITDSVFMDNAAVHTGGGMWASTMTSLRISGSAFVGNTTGQPNGGGIYFAGIGDAGAPENVIENTTFSDNRTTHQFGKASALAVAGGNMTLRNDTFAFNKVAPDLVSDGSGAAVWIAGSSASAKVESTLFAYNTDGSQNVLSDLIRDNVSGPSQSTVDASHCSFETMPDSNTLNGTSEANLFATDPLLAPLTLADGGITPVHPLARTSPVIDRGSNSGDLATDQRGPGFARAWSEHGAGIADIGAYEVRGDTIFFGDFEQH
jgi:hypothetical protein